MNKFTILFLTLLLALPVAMKAESAKEKRDDTRYLTGAVPEVDGKVVFSKEFQIPGMSQAQIYDTIMKWMQERLKENMSVRLQMNLVVRADHLQYLWLRYLQPNLEKPFQKKQK